VAFCVSVCMSVRKISQSCEWILLMFSKKNACVLQTNIVMIPCYKIIIVAIKSVSCWRRSGFFHLSRIIFQDS